MNRIGDKFLDEDVVVHGVADSPANDTNGQGKGGHGSNEIIGAYDGGHDGGRDNNAANAKTGKNQEAPECVEVVDAGDGERAASWDID